MLHSLFEVSWEICNKVGGIHTVVSTKAQSLVERLGDDYVAVGPWLLSDSDAPPPFEEDSGFEAFTERCRGLGVPVRVGRWLIPGRPRTLLVEFSGLYEKKDDILAGLWDAHEVDSIVGDWDYVEPVLFGHAAGIVIERWWEEYGAPDPRGTVAQFHEWMTGAGMLHLLEKVPAIGTVFTTHATMLGRSVASRGKDPVAGLEGRTPEQLADEIGIRSKHSMEGSCARAADVFTTVSEITAAEAEAFHGRRPDPLLPNGIDLDVVAEIAGDTPRDEVRRRLLEFAESFLGESADDAVLLSISGRYEFHNKGIDVLLDALAKLNGRDGGRSVVLFAMIPAGNSGLTNELVERLDGGPIDGPVGVSTHNLFDADRDPIQQRCRELGLDNALGSRVKVIQTPIYFDLNDGLFGLPYEAVARAMDLSAFPSFYEPWGYTPEESLALGVPTITTDCAGFGRWIEALGLAPSSGVRVLKRQGLSYEASVDALTEMLEASIDELGAEGAQADACRATANLTSWSDLIQHYETAFERARDAAIARGAPGPKRFRTPATVTVSDSDAEGDRPAFHRFEVAPSIPPVLDGLTELSRNLWWSWNEDATRLYEELSPRAWAETNHGPTRVLEAARVGEMADRAADVAYTAAVDEVAGRLRAYLDATADTTGARGLSREHPIAYFCAEFGMHESLPIYSGGLGVLAGDHLKAASDLDLPLVAIGLFYRFGYVRQHLSATGQVLSVEVPNDPTAQPVELVLDEDGAPLEIMLRLPSSVLTLRVWRAQVGRVELYLLDSDVESNRPDDRAVTHRLYGGTHENRLLQEIVLGRGGVRLLRRLEIEPSVYHLNEGHAAFVAIERIGRQVRREGLTFDEARVLVRATTAFTTHTPVPAGHDQFDEALLRRYFSDVSQWAGITWEAFVALGRAHGSDGADGSFNMTYFASRFAAFVNGVSREHGLVSRPILHPVWPMRLESEVPVTSVTNGVHLPTWTGPEIARLLGAEGRLVTGADFAEKAPGLDSAELWAARSSARARLIETVRVRTEAAFLRRHDSPTVLAKTLAALDEDCLLIGFARRFAPYKRASLILHDIERLTRILDDPDRPVRLLVAGKAHPQDTAGINLVRKLAEAARSDALIGKILFLEDYDIALARALVQGADVWLNTPIRPLEASGTSGMKVAANGGLNLSISDGWWMEAADGTNGWTIGNERKLPMQDLQDEFEVDHLYRLLEEEIVPLFFDRDSEGVPEGWLRFVRRSLATIPPFFDTMRMVGEYAERAYEPLAHNFVALGPTAKPELRRVAAAHRRVRRGFTALQIRSRSISDLSAVKVGDSVDVKVEVELGELTPDDIVVEVLFGKAREGQRDLGHAALTALDAVETNDGVTVFAGTAVIERSGASAWGVRVRAQTTAARDRALDDLAVWAS